jgi:hypothetical protein
VREPYQRDERSLRDVCRDSALEILDALRESAVDLLASGSPPGGFHAGSITWFWLGVNGWAVDVLGPVEYLKQFGAMYLTFLGGTFAGWLGYKCARAWLAGRTA